MAREYEASDRSAKPNRANLYLALPSSNGPLSLDSIAGLQCLRMSEPAFGCSVAGFYTTGVSDCSVIAIAEWRPGTSGRFYFEHVAGSDVTANITNRAQQIIGDGGPNCFAVVAQYYGGVAFDAADRLFGALNVPPNNCTHYNSNYSGMDFGLRLADLAIGEYATISHK